MLLALIEKMTASYFAAIPRCKPGLKQAQAACLIAHRGAHNNDQGILENTLVAFNLAQKAGCWGIELDVHATADKVLVVNHDPDLKRLWGQDVVIANLSFAALRALVPGVPALSEVVARFGKNTHLFIELKAPFQDEEALLSVLQDLIAVEDYHLLSLDAALFHSLSQFPQQAFLLVASHNNVQEFCELSLKEGYGGVLGHYLLLTNKSVHALKAAQQRVGVGFVDSKYSLYRELNRGIDWIFTNRAAAENTYLQPLLDPSESRATGGGKFSQ